MTEYQWATILSHMTPTEWGWESTGGNCQALAATLDSGRFLMITNEALSDEITPTEPVVLGVYASADMAHDSEGEYHYYPNMGMLLAEIGARAED